jgi:hypothetical protein
VSGPSKPSDVRFQVARTETMSMCLRCGALVGDERRHRRFHTGLSELIKAIEVMIMFGG